MVVKTSKKPLVSAAGFVREIEVPWEFGTKENERPKSRDVAKPQSPRRSVIPADQIDAPQRRRDILLTAIHLFSEHGYNGVSVRDIADGANVPIALCGYYFGRKSELFSSLFVHSANDVGRRVEAIRVLAGERSDQNILEKLVRTWAEPVLQMRADPQNASFAALVARTLWDTAEEAQSAIARFYDPVAFAFLDVLQQLMPDRDPADLVWGYEWALGALLMHLADKRVERISKGRVQAGDAGKSDMLIRFICTGLNSIPGKSCLA